MPPPVVCLVLQCTFVDDDAIALPDAMELLDDIELPEAIELLFAIMPPPAVLLPAIMPPWAVLAVLGQPFSVLEDMAFDDDIELLDDMELLDDIELEAAKAEVSIRPAARVPAATRLRVRRVIGGFLERGGPACRAHDPAFAPARSCVTPDSA
jgi:hypothetical protein